MQLVYVCVCVLRRSVSCHKIVTLWRSCAGTGMGLAVQLTLHEEIALLLKVHITV